MLLKEAIDKADNIRPNEFTYYQKTDMINELEHMFQADLLLTTPDKIITHKFALKFNRSMRFTDVNTLEVNVPLTYVQQYNKIRLADLSSYSDNNGVYTISAIEDNEITVEEDFTTTGTTFETGSIIYDGSHEELLIGAPWEELYVSFLLAKYDYTHGEYDRYSNTVSDFNTKYSHFKKWYTEHFCGRRNYRGLL